VSLIQFVSFVKPLATLYGSHTIGTLRLLKQNTKSYAVICCASLKTIAQSLFVGGSAVMIPPRDKVRTVAPYTKVSFNQLEKNVLKTLPEEFCQTILGPDHPGAKEATAKRYGPAGKKGGSTKKMLPGVQAIGFTKDLVRFLRQESAEKVDKEALQDLQQLILNGIIHGANLILQVPGTGDKIKVINGGNLQKIIKLAVNRYRQRVNPSGVGDDNTKAGSMLSDSENEDNGSSTSKRLPPNFDLPKVQANFGALIKELGNSKNEAMQLTAVRDFIGDSITAWNIGKPEDSGPMVRIQACVSKLPQLIDPHLDGLPASQTKKISPKSFRANLLYNMLWVLLGEACRPQLVSAKDRLLEAMSAHDFLFHSDEDSMTRLGNTAYDLFQA
jgi:hypothetical protein